MFTGCSTKERVCLSLSNEDRNEITICTACVLANCLAKYSTTLIYMSVASLAVVRTQLAQLEVRPERKIISGFKTRSWNTYRYQSKQ